MKKIAITQRLIETTEYPETRDALDIRWGSLFRELGVLPVLLPTGYDCAPYFQEMGIDGVILSGGNDLYRLSGMALSALRDDFEKRVLSAAISRGIPVVGVCRGMQLIGDYFGMALGPVRGHTAGARHRLEASAESRYAPLLRQVASVNSYHNYALTGGCQALVVAATSDCGVVEAIEHRELPVFGQMWHTERETTFPEAELALLRAALGL